MRQLVYSVSLLGNVKISPPFSVSVSHTIQAGWLGMAVEISKTVNIAQRIEMAVGIERWTWTWTWDQKSYSHLLSSCHDYYDSAKGAYNMQSKGTSLLRFVVWTYLFSIVHNFTFAMQIFTMFYLVGLSVSQRNKAGKQKKKTTHNRNRTESLLRKVKQKQLEVKSTAYGNRT